MASGAPAALAGCQAAKWLAVAVPPPAAGDPRLWAAVQAAQARRLSAREAGACCLCMAAAFSQVAGAIQPRKSDLERFDWADIDLRHAQHL